MIINQHAEADGEKSAFLKTMLICLFVFLIGMATVVILHFWHFVNANGERIDSLTLLAAKLILFGIAAYFAITMNFLYRRRDLEIKRQKLENDHYQQQLNQITTSNELRAATNRQLDRDKIYLIEHRNAEGVIKFKALAKTPKTEQLSVIAPIVSEIKSKSLSDEIKHYDSMLVIGAQQGCGKTTALGHIAIQKINNGDTVIVCDPHYSRNINVWHPDCEIIGNGRNYDEIKSKIKSLVNEMNARFNRASKEQRIYIIMDEMTTVSERIESQSEIKNLLTEGRKANIFFIAGTHSKRVDALGITGNGDLLKGFDAILYCRVNKQSREYTIKMSVFDDGGKEIDNGIFPHFGTLNLGYKLNNYQPVINSDFQNKIDSILNNPIEELTIEKKIISAYWELKNAKKAVSLSAICIAVFGYKKGDKIKQISAILDANSLVTDS